MTYRPALPTPPVVAPSAPAPAGAHDHSRAADIRAAVVWIGIRGGTGDGVSSGWALHRVPVCVHALRVARVVALLQAGCGVLSSACPGRATHQRAHRAPDGGAGAHLAT